MPATQAIQISGLTKSFGTTKALNGLDLTVETGEVHGFLGPNGAGKSTTLRILLGLLSHDAGSVKILGADPWRDAVQLHRRLAYVPGDVSLWPNISGGEAIDLLTRLRGGVDRDRKNELLARFELDPTKKARTYSKGNRQKVALVAALASDVELLVLDEPTSGLDPLMEAEFMSCIAEVRAAGRSVLLSSHILAEAEKLCDTVTIIRNGITVETGSLKQLRHLTRSTITATTGTDPAGLASLPGIHDLVIDGLAVTFGIDNEHLDVAMRSLSGLGLRSLVSTPPSLEELFLRHYGDEAGPQAATSRTSDTVTASGATR